MIDFDEFEALFKLGNLSLNDDLSEGTPRTQRKKKPEAVSLLDPNRLRNVGKYSFGGANNNIINNCKAQKLHYMFHIHIILLSTPTLSAWTIFFMSRLVVRN